MFECERVTSSVQADECVYFEAGRHADVQADGVCVQYGRQPRLHALQTDRQTDIRTDADLGASCQREDRSSCFILPLLFFFFFIALLQVYPGYSKAMPPFKPGQSR